MTLRIVAALAAVVGVGGLLFYLHELGMGPFATPPQRHLRAMKDRASVPPAYLPMTVAGMGELPRRRPLAEYARIEQQGATVEGYVQKVLRSPDGDFHLSLSPLPPRREGPTFRSAIAEVTPQWQRGSRAWTYPGLVEQLLPTFGGVTAWEHGPRRARLSGWLMYDYPHEGFIPRDPHSLPPISAWEIHPVTRIELWDDSLGQFVEFAR